MSHATEAEHLLNRAAVVRQVVKDSVLLKSDWTEELEDAELDMKEAHVHAMLAVAEQQRLANLFAVVQSETNIVNPAWATGTAYEDLVASIREGLGL
jgi:hypothetical protein